MTRNPRTFRFVRPLAMACLLILVVVGCRPPGTPAALERHVMPNDVMDFSRLFAVNCAGCHGRNGELGPAPPLNDPLFAAIISDDELREVIRAGRPMTPMPAFAVDNGGSLTERQIDVLAAGIKTVWNSATVARDDVPAYALVPIRKGVRPSPFKGSDPISDRLLITSGEAEASPEVLQRGAQVFARACAGCHGADGLGHERDGAMVGGIHAPQFLGLISDQAIRRLIITGRPDLGMPDYSGTAGRSDDFEPLTDSEIDDLVALIAHWRRRALDTSPRSQDLAARLPWFRSSHLDVQPSNTFASVRMGSDCD